MLLSPTIRLVRPLGAGGMGSVWVADHLALRIQVVVKLIADALLSSRSAMDRFAREASAAAQVKSPHVVQMLDYGVTQDGTPYIVMELLEGHDLGEELKRVGRIPLARFVSLFEQTASALARAHERGVVHRDVKPENIFLCDVGQSERFVKVLDFGIAKGTGSTGESAHTRTGAAVGTPYYMSPEQIDAAAVDHRADLWALGVVAFQALTGTRPFQGETYLAIAMAVNKGATFAPSQYERSLPPAVDAWYFRACARDIRQRFTSATEMAQALSAAAASAAVPAASPSQSVGQFVVRSNPGWTDASPYQQTAIQLPPAMTPPGMTPVGMTPQAMQAISAAPGSGQTETAPGTLAGTGATNAQFVAVPAKPKRGVAAIVLLTVSALAIAGGAVGLTIYLTKKNANPPTRTRTSASATANDSASPIDSAAKEANPDAIKFTKVPYSVGTVWDMQVEETVELKITVPIAQTQSQTTQTSETLEVLATEGPAVTRLKVVYNHQSVIVTKYPAAPVEKPTPVNGKTYVVELAGGVVVILDDHRVAAPADEDQYVRAEWGLLGRPDPLLAALPDLPVKRGQSVNGIAEMLTQQDAGAEVVSYDDKHASLKDIVSESGQQVGIFAFGYKTHLSRGAQKVDGDVTGTLAVRASDAHELRYEFGGPQWWTKQIEATGTAHTKYTFTYR